MPGGDRTGPLGMGPGTGRFAGFCAGYNVPGYMNPVFGAGRGFGYGRGFGRGRGGGRGRGWYGYYPYNPYPLPYADSMVPQAGINRESEVEMLKSQILFFQDQLKGTEERLKELENSKEEKRE